MKSRPKPKLFVVRKYIMAKTAAEALRKERKTPADECWVDEDWKKNQVSSLADAVGFQLPRPEEPDDDL